MTKPTECPHCKVDHKRVTMHSLGKNANGDFVEVARCMKCYAEWNNVFVFDSQNVVSIPDGMEAKFAELLPVASRTIKNHSKVTHYNYGIVKWLQGLDRAFRRYDKHRDSTKGYKSVARALMLPVEDNYAQPAKNIPAEYKHMYRLQFARAKELAIDAAEEGYSWYADPDMVAMNLGDAADHFKLAFAFLSGKRARIYKASNMDTASREMIPDRVWKFFCDLYQ